MLIHDPNIRLSLPPKLPMPRGLRRSPNRQLRGTGTYHALRSDLSPGAITRREFLRFMTYIALGDECVCSPIPHQHWLWTGRISSLGYGTFNWRGRHFLPHVFAFIVLGYEIPYGHELDHLCRIRHCCQPFCVEPTTHKENVMRGAGLAAMFVRRTHCKAGHLLDGNNIRRSGPSRKNARDCRICHNTRSRKYLHDE